MNCITKRLLTICTFMLCMYQYQAQCENTNSMCAKHMQNEFISDGQNYQTFLLEEQTAEFQTTFFKDVTYRIAACTGDADGQLTFKVYDRDRDMLLFSNLDFENSPYWNFVAEDNFDCIIEAELQPGKSASGCAVILIGFKN